MNNRPHAVRKRVILALATLPFFGVVAAFGIAPDTTIDPIELSTVVETVVPPEIQATDSGVFDFWREERIGRGETLSGLLSRMDVDADDIQGVMAVARQNPALGRLASGRTVLARVTSGGSLMLMRYMANDETLISVERAGDGFRVAEQAIQPEMRPIMRSGVIQGSLFGATDAADVPDRIASAMAEAFSGEIDFHRDLRRGDQFSVVYEAFYVDGRLVRRAAAEVFGPRVGTRWLGWTAAAVGVPCSLSRDLERLIVTACDGLPRGRERKPTGPLLRSHCKRRGLTFSPPPTAPRPWPACQKLTPTWLWSTRPLWAPPGCGYANRCARSKMSICRLCLLSIPIKPSKNRSPMSLFTCLLQFRNWSIALNRFC